MPGLVVRGKQLAPSGLAIENWFDTPAVRLKITEGTPPHDGYVRGDTGWMVRNICHHTTEGTSPVIVHPGVGPSHKYGERIVHSWTHSNRAAGAHLIIDFDGTIVCTADLLTEATYHATSVNGHSIGIEMCQTTAGETWEAQYDAAVRLDDALTLCFGIQRQYQEPFNINQIARIHAGALDVVGVYCHYHQTTNRGPGDCGPHLFERLCQAGYMPVDYRLETDLAAGRNIQQSLGMTGDAVDGVMGPGTVNQLRARGTAYGQRVSRPTDAADAALFQVDR